MIDLDKQNISDDGQTILIVDDDPDTCDLVKIIFQANGYGTLVAHSGAEALRCVEESRPTVVIMDVMMPGMDGWETYRGMRTFSSVPVLFLTALTSGEVAAQALRLGVDDFMRKPFYPEELLVRTEVLLRKRKKHSAPEISVQWREGYAQRPGVSVVIPTFNEAENLPLVLPYLPMDWVDEVILVDGRSTDGTIKVARSLLPSIKVVLEPRAGKGAALRAGYQAACGDIIVVIDADGSHDPREIPSFVMALQGGADFVKGSRFAPGGGTSDMPRLRKFGNRFFVAVVNLMFNVDFTDLCYGFHAFWRYCLEAIDLSDVEGFEIDTAIYVRALLPRLRIKEVPSFEGYRFRGVGKLRTFPDGWRVLRTILLESYRGYRRPDYAFAGFRGKPLPCASASKAKSIQNALPGPLEVPTSQVNISNRVEKL